MYFHRKIFDEKARSLLLISFPGKSLLVDAQYEDINKSLEAVTQVSSRLEGCKGRLYWPEANDNGISFQGKDYRSFSCDRFRTAIDRKKAREKVILSSGNDAE